MPCHFIKANGMTFWNVCPAILGPNGWREAGEGLSVAVGGQRKFGNSMSPEWTQSEAWVNDDPSGKSAMQREKGTRGSLTQTGILSNRGETEEQGGKTYSRDQQPSQNIDVPLCLMWEQGWQLQISENHEPVYRHGFKQSSKRKNLIAFPESGIWFSGGQETHSTPCLTSAPSIGRHNPEPFQVLLNF